MNALKKFSKHLKSIEYPERKTSWNIAGILKNKNAFYKFDVRDMIKLPDGTPAQKGKTNSKADKLVLEIKNKWVILDIKELFEYIKKTKISRLYLDDILPKLEWTIFIKK